MYTVVIPVCLNSGTVKEDVFDRAHSIATEVTGRVIDLVDAVHVGGDGGVVSASETGEVDSVFAW